MNKDRSCLTGRGTKNGMASAMPFSVPPYRVSLIVEGIFLHKPIYLNLPDHFGAFSLWVKLKRILNRNKCSGFIPTVGHSLFHCSHSRILEPASLMCVVYPAADDIVILNLFNWVSDIPPAVFTFCRHGEGCKNIGICRLSPEDVVRGKYLTAN